jgi:hypothetical protein
MVSITHLPHLWLLAEHPENTTNTDVIWPELFIKELYFPSFGSAVIVGILDYIELKNIGRIQKQRVTHFRRF